MGEQSGVEALVAIEARARDGQRTGGRRRPGEIGPRIQQRPDLLCVKEWLDPVVTYFR